ncbi:hypothetical protein [Pseudomonas helleri]|uniref:hypothetical protein n=1 Tax=Pseudomonas helleri TaxID=1608996 RepID=UPI0012970838|nr:hypothetical protein [Pseudomonas helleri]
MNTAIKSTPQRVPGQKSIRPSVATVRSYWLDLRTAADAGDHLAKALLIALSEGRLLVSEHYSQVKP